jgi:hypothetical protein
MSTGDGADPFEVLGVPWDAPVRQLRDARRRLAKQLHPDCGGDGAAMQSVNAAFETAVAHATGRRVLTRPGEADVSTATGDDAEAERESSDDGGTAGQRRARRMHYGVQRDDPSFTLNVLPVEAYEVLLVVSATIGESVTDDPPYVLETLIAEPLRCWCRLDLVPDAGGTTVTLTVARAGDTAAPHIDDVRDLWVAELNQL